jgi:RimJ/RimL family protein N-acetyltransferase
MSVVVETERLILRTWTLEDAPDALRIWGDPEVMRFVDDGVPLAGVEEARAVLGRAIRAQEVLGHCLWCAVEKSSGRFVGCCGFHRFEGGPALELAYHLVPEAQGRGYATEAARGCLRFGFEVLAAPRIVALIHPRNDASRRVLEKAGFHETGVVRGEVLFECVGTSPV